MAADQVPGPAETFSAASAAAASSVSLSLAFHPQYFQFLTDTVLDSTPGGDEGRGPFSSPRSAPEAPFDTAATTKHGFVQDPRREHRKAQLFMCKYSETCSGVRQ